MRTTLTIDDDVLIAAKELAEERKISVGAVVSDLLRASLHPKSHPVRRNGILLLPARGGARVTTEMVNRLRDELP